MFRIIPILFLVFSFSCANIPVTEPDLYKIYSKLPNLIKSGVIISGREKYFTSSYLTEIDLDDKKSLFLLKLPGYITSTAAHYQKITKNTGCLTVNGFDKNKNPISLYIEYKKNESQWLINYIYLDFKDMETDFLKGTACPKEIEK